MPPWLFRFLAWLVAALGAAATAFIGRLISQHAAVLERTMGAALTVGAALIACVCVIVAMWIAGVEAGRTSRR